ncbi:MAG: nucleoside/nucleotide kinase family protein [Dermatophilus congolensis]|nr:nucleoside/nucleotide kinase family protein [Dermatophilus congolensis]
MTPPVLRVEEAAARVRELARAAAASDTRFILGLVGAPGIGKSTLAEHLVAQAAEEAATGLFTMDGFHLAHQVLSLRGDVARKGAPETFDSAGFVALLRRLRARDEAMVWAPDYQRDLHNAVAAAVSVPRSLPFLVTEGNYLLLGDGAWAGVRGLLDEVWYVEGDEDLRVQRLAERHVRHGRTPEAALDRALTGVDAENAALVKATRDRADVVVDVSGWES